MSELPEKPYNAADPESVRDRKRREKRTDDEYAEDLRQLLTLPAARRFLRRLIFEECHLNETSYHASGQQFAANEGRRGVGAQLQAEIMHADLEGWIALVRESQGKS